MISVGHQQVRPQPQAVQGGDDEFELSEEDLVTLAGRLVDDRQNKQGKGCVCYQNPNPK